MKKYLIRTWDNYSILWNDGDSSSDSLEIDDLEKAINQAKSQIRSQLKFDSFDEFVSSIDSMKTMGHSPQVIDVETDRQVDSFSDSTYLEELSFEHFGKNYR